MQTGHRSVFDSVANTETSKLCHPVRGGGDVEITNWLVKAILRFIPNGQNSETHEDSMEKPRVGKTSMFPSLVFLSSECDIAGRVLMVIPFSESRKLP